VYLRHSTRRKGGKAHTYWRLVRSVRRDRKVVQETVAHLGELDRQGRANAKALARQMTGGGDQRELFEAEPCAAQTISVRLDQVRVERQRAFGGVWLGWEPWRALGLDGLCRELLPPGRESVPWPVTAAVLVLARLCEPSSELHIAALGRDPDPRGPRCSTPTPGDRRRRADGSGPRSRAPARRSADRD
jgi:hypothetical protein